jgi:hypothetical protein
MSSPLWYTSIDQIDSYADKAGETDWTCLSYDDKLFCLELSTTDIEQLHGQPRSSGVPWQLGNYQLQEACQYQALYNSRVLDDRRSNWKNRTLSSGSFADGVLSITPKKTIDYDNRAFVLVGHVMQNLGVNASNNVWGRG